VGGGGRGGDRRGDGDSREISGDSRIALSLLANGARDIEAALRSGDESGGLIDYSIIGEQERIGAIDLSGGANFSSVGG